MQQVVQHKLVEVEDQEVHQLIIDLHVDKDKVIHHQYPHHKVILQVEQVMLMQVEVEVQVQQVQMEL